MQLSVLDQSPIPEGFTPADALANTIDLARLTDRLGYTRYWVAEHHAMRSLASTAPEIVVARLGAETSRIRVGTGGVLIPYYAPLKVAETFRVLHALYPDRIDLGIGRAPGASGWEVHALMQGNVKQFGEDTVQQLLQLRAFLNGGWPEDHQYRNILVSPDMPGAPEIWLLGSSLYSADLAGQIGLPYAFAHFIMPESTGDALQHYFGRVPGVEDAGPKRAFAAVGAICAETAEEADHLAMSARLFRRRIRMNDRRPIPTPEAAIAELGPKPDTIFDRPAGGWSRYFIGTPDTVKAEMTEMATAFGIDEIMIVTIVHDHAARRRSYELLAEAFGLDASSR